MTGVRAAGLVALATMAACVDHDELALCPAFVEYVIVYDTLEATDPSDAGSWAKKTSAAVPDPSWRRVAASSVEPA